MIISGIEPKTSSGGKPYAVITSGDQKGSCWDKIDFKVGDDVDGEFTMNGTYTNFKLKRKVGAPNFVQKQRSAEIEKAQETKREDIAEAQNRKHDAIKLAGAFRDATLISLASLKEMPFPTDDQFKDEWTKWVKWLLLQGDQPFI